MYYCPKRQQTCCDSDTNGPQGFINGIDVFLNSKIEYSANTYQAKSSNRVS